MEGVGSGFEFDDDGGGVFTGSAIDIFDAGDVLDVGDDSLCDGLYRINHYTWLSIKMSSF